MQIRKKKNNFLGSSNVAETVYPDIVRKYLMKEENGQHCQMMYTRSNFSYQKVICTHGRGRCSEVVEREPRLQIDWGQLGNQGRKWSE